MHLLIGVRIGLDPMIKRLTGKVLQNKAFSVSVFYQVLLAAYREWGHGSDSNQMQPFHAGASSLTLAGVIVKKGNICDSSSFHNAYFNAFSAGCHR